ncbi:MAG: integron integrase [Planctomycetia bacterium]|nr:integron integrase [Planctomycetia bacterium]
MRHLSYRTEQSYVAWVRRFILFHNKRHPTDMGATEVRAFLTHLAVNRRVAASTQNQALNALVFMDREVLRRDHGEFGEFQCAKRPKRLPTVLTRDEVPRVLAHIDGTHGLMARLLYGTGMRLMECVQLRIKDVDFARGTITVRSGKGDKDRVTMLPEALRQSLQQHIERLRALYEEDRAANLPGVELPHALAVKTPHAGISWPWQRVFPARNVSRDPQWMKGLSPPKVSSSVCFNSFRKSNYQELIFGTVSDTSTGVAKCGERRSGGIVLAVNRRHWLTLAATAGGSEPLSRALR